MPQFLLGSLAETPPAMFHFEQRNAKANLVIEKYCLRHAALDAGLGLAGFVPVPGMGVLATAASILAAAPAILKPMTLELCTVYAATSDQTTQTIQQQGIAMQAIGDIGVEIAREIFPEIVKEASTTLAVSFLPFFGKAAGVFLDAAIAATTTWRVGTATMLYFANGGEWIEDRQHTLALAKVEVGPLSPGTRNRVDFDDCAKRNPDVNRKFVQSIAAIIEVLRGVLPNARDIWQHLVRQGVPEWAIQIAMAQSFA